ncbi:MAG TPA: hypothetical protein ENK91_10865 [Bacteroidetes bacterium]|nr:hypothetical protein [Bacteroidota bacterium]
MASKYKMTGCAKFFIFLIIAVPLAYIGASYYNGADPFQKLKNIEIFKKDKATVDDTKNINAPIQNESTLKKELELKNEEIDFLKKKIKNLEGIIDAQKAEIEKLKKS